MLSGFLSSHDIYRFRRRLPFASHLTMLKAVKYIIAKTPKEYYHFEK